MSTVRRPFLRVLSMLLLLCVLAPAGARADYRTLKIGDKGPDVVELKKRLYELGYFNSKSFGNDYTKNTAEKIRRFVSKYGEDGDVATPEVQERLYSEDARPESYVPMTGPACVGLAVRHLIDGEHHMKTRPRTVDPPFIVLLFLPVVAAVVDGEARSGKGGGHVVRGDPF